jgi:hypothetical protein
MSAFVMDERFFDKLASELFAHATLRHSKLNWAVTYSLDLRGDEFNHVERKVQLFAVDCYELNVASVNQRYDQNDQPQPLRFVEASGLPKWSDEQLLKYLECLSYQCCEGECEKSETYQKLERLIGRVARAIVGASDRYEVANWDYAAA